MQKKTFNDIHCTSSYDQKEEKSKFCSPEQVLQIKGHQLRNQYFRNSSPNPFQLKEK